MSESLCEEKCKRAFRNENHSAAIALLPSLQKHNDIMCQSIYGGNTYLVHVAAINGWLDIVELLTTQYSCDPQRKDYWRYTALHYAVQEGHLDVTRYLTLHCKCNINATDKNGNTPLHWAARKGHHDIVQFLVECGGGIMATNENKATPFHLACQYNSNNRNIPVIRYFLSLPVILNAFFNKSRRRSSSSSCEDVHVRAVHNKFQRIQVSHPVGSFVNVFLLGNPGVGKTTLCQAIKDRSKNASQSVRHIFQKSQVKEVKLCTAGVVPSQLHDESLGHVIVHDFAGQPVYYPSHMAVLEDLLRCSGAIFVIVVNLMQDLSQQLRFWSNIVNNECLKVSSKCHLIVVGSHADQLKEQKLQIENRIRKELLVAGIDHSIASVFPLDCRLCSKDNLQPFIESLSYLCTSLRNKQAPFISLYCNFLFSILQAKVSTESNVCTLERLILLCNQSRQQDVPLPDDIVPLLKALHSSGLIVYLENAECLPKSWVVVNKEILLAEVDGILFAPSTVVEHSNIASNTGVITTGALQRLFPHYSSDMLTRFLKSMKFCEELDKILIKVTNLDCTALDACDQLLFFPALMTNKRPEHAKKLFKIWWCLALTSGHSFSIRFLHVLLLRLIRQYSQSVCHVSPSLPGGLKQQCSVWIDGIHWYNDDGIEVLVEQMEDNRCVTMLMSCQDGAEEKMIRLHCELIEIIVRLQQEYCPILQCKEHLLAPKQEYPLDRFSKVAHYDMEQLKHHITQGKRTILCVDASAPAIAITELLPIEPKKYLSILKVS